MSSCGHNTTADSTFDCDGCIAAEAAAEAAVERARDNLAAAVKITAAVADCSCGTPAAAVDLDFEIWDPCANCEDAVEAAAAAAKAAAAAPFSEPTLADDVQSSLKAPAHLGNLMGSAIAAAFSSERLFDFDQDAAE